ncbi:Tenascin-N like protein [Argiope bruennichi]|uniref:Tenascin-N like protein n=1 Tax=Argiope bruennichi TaxID=94029 RepID=A0A8T0FIH8_ARGBR|nr:Tenascin-N like protein [Argiope bruennichi]
MHLVALDLAKESITKAKELQPDCFNDSSNISECGAKEKVLAYLDFANKLIEEAKQNFSICDVTKNHTKIVLLHEKPKDCSEVMENGNNKSGVYTIWPSHGEFHFKQLTVYCDMDTDGGG